METIKKYFTQILLSIITAAVIGIFSIGIAIYSDYKTQPEKWDANKTTHDRFEELFQQEMAKTQQLQIDVGILKAKK